MKAILVIDMPKNGCESCMFDNYGLCIVRANEKDVHKRANREWCPLKPLPQRQPKDNSNEVNLGFELGWNACLEEIEK